MAGRGEASLPQRTGSRFPSPHVPCVPDGCPGSRLQEPSARVVSASLTLWPWLPRAGHPAPALWVGAVPSARRLVSCQRESCQAVAARLKGHYVHDLRMDSLSSERGRDQKKPLRQRSCSLESGNGLALALRIVTLPLGPGNGAPRR